MLKQLFENNQKIKHLTNQIEQINSDSETYLIQNRKSIKSLMPLGNYIYKIKKGEVNHIDNWGWNDNFEYTFIKVLKNDLICKRTSRKRWNIIPYVNCVVLDNLMNPITESEYYEREREGKEPIIVNISINCIGEVATPINDNSQKNILYLINITDSNLFKIGITNNLNNRLSGLQTANPMKLNVYKHYECGVANYHESVLHKKYEKNNVQGEWFNLHPYDLKYIDEYMKLKMT